MLRLIALATLLAGSLLAQDITGTWQGTLQAGGQGLRVMFKISKADAVWKVLFYSIDQGPDARPGNLTVQGSSVKLAVPSMGGGFEGTLDAEGTNLKGTWAQGAAMLPLVLKHVVDTEAWPLPDPAPRLKPMAADADPSFEVAAIKPSGPQDPGPLFQLTNRQFRSSGTSPLFLVVWAYGLHPRQVTGGAAWTESERYNITAKPDGEGQPSQDQYKKMLQKLLADRFKLTFHREKKELTVYAIVLGKTGAKLTKNDDPNGARGMAFQGLGDLPARNATMADLASTLQAVVMDRPVVDQTGLEGKFDFHLKWTPDDTQFVSLGVKIPANDKPDAPPDIYTAMQDQLGLRLTTTKATVEVLVIDRIEKPSGN